jgi:hypothetical protein
MRKLAAIKRMFGHSRMGAGVEKRGIRQADRLPILGGRRAAQGEESERN